MTTMQLPPVRTLRRYVAVDGRYADVTHFPEGRPHPYTANTYTADHNPDPDPQRYGYAFDDAAQVVAWMERIGYCPRTADPLAPSSSRSTSAPPARREVVAVPEGQGMTRAALIALIEARGALDVAQMVRSGSAQVSHAFDDAWDVTPWYVTVAPGALLFYRSRDGQTTDEGRILVANAGEDERTRWQEMLDGRAIDREVDTVLVLQRVEIPF